MGRRLAGLLALHLLVGCAPGLATRARDWLPRTAAEHRPTLVDAPAPDLGRPQGLRAVSGELRVVPLQWEPLLDGDVAGYRIERTSADTDEGAPDDTASANPDPSPGATSPVGAASFEPAGEVFGRFHTSFVDGAAEDRAWPGRTPSAGRLADGVPYRYRVRAFDRAGRLAPEASEPVEARTAPAPLPPEGLRAYSHLPRRIALTWSPSPDPTVRSYVLYRSPSQHGAYTPIASIEGRFRGHSLDEGLGDLRVFYYRVAAVNAAGGEGVRSEPVRGLTKAEPLPPVGLRVTEQRLGANHLVWDPNVERDIARYRLLRWREGSEAAEEVGEIAAPDTAAWDEAVGAGELVTYRVLALDGDGLESDGSDPVIVVSERYHLAAEVLPGALRLTWRGRPEEGFVAARIERAGWLGWRELARVESAQHVDRDVQPGSAYRYRVELERADGSRAPPSEVLEVVFPERGP